MYAHDKIICCSINPFVPGTRYLVYIKIQKTECHRRVVNRFIIVIDICTFMSTTVASAMLAIVVTVQREAPFEWMGHLQHSFIPWPSSPSMYTPTIEALHPTHLSLNCPLPTSIPNRTVHHLHLHCPHSRDNRTGGNLSSRASHANGDFWAVGHRHLGCIEWDGWVHWANVHCTSVHQCCRQWETTAPVKRTRFQ